YLKQSARHPNQGRQALTRVVPPIFRRPAAGSGATLVVPVTVATGAAYAGRGHCPPFGARLTGGLRRSACREGLPPAGPSSLPARDHGAVPFTALPTILGARGYYCQPLKWSRRCY